MRFKANPTPLINNPPSQLMRLTAFKGLNLATTATEIAETESPDLLNITVDPYGTILKRRGYLRLFPISLGAGRITGLFNYFRINGTMQTLFTWGGKLYNLPETGAPTEIPTPAGIADHDVNTFVMNDKLYIQDGTHYYQYDGSTVINVASIAYIPTLNISRAPNATATTYNEDYNLLQPGFKDSFSATGTDTVYYLSQDHLDATLLTARVNNVDYQEGISFTVDRTAGTVNFAGGTTPLGAPVKGTNNVLITAYKTHPGLADEVLKCTFNVLYGGTNDTKVFIAGNPSDIATARYSGTYDPTYFANNDYIQVGNSSEAIMGFSIQYDTLVIHKERSHWHITFAFDNNGIPYFPLKPINDSIGCIAKNSVQLANNSPLCLDLTGVYILTQSNVRDERNMQSISKPVDRLLLAENNLQDAITTDYDNKYYLVLNNNAYIYDYYQNIWFKWDNIKASCFLVHDRHLYFGSNTEGLIYRFMTREDDNQNLYNDDGVAINAYWRSKILNLGDDASTKLIDKMFVTLKPGLPASADVYYQTDLASQTFAGIARRKLFNYYALNYADWSYRGGFYPDVEPFKIRAKKVVYVQILLSNNRLDDSMQVLDIELKYAVQGYKK